MSLPTILGTQDSYFDSISLNELGDVETYLKQLQIQTGPRGYQGKQGNNVEFISPLIVDSVTSYVNDVVTSYTDVNGVTTSTHQLVFGLKGGKDGKDGKDSDTASAIAAAASAVTATVAAAAAVLSATAAATSATAAATSATGAAESAAAAEEAAASQNTYARHFLASDAPNTETCNAILRIKDNENISTVTYLDRSGNISTTNSISLNTAGDGILANSSTSIDKDKINTNNVNISNNLSVRNINPYIDPYGFSLVRDINIGTSYTGINVNRINVGNAFAVINLVGAIFVNGQELSNPITHGYQFVNQFR